MTTVAIYVEREGEELELEVTGTISPYRLGCRWGENACPDEGGEIEVESVTLAGKPWTGDLTSAELDDAEQKLIDASADDEEDCREWDDDGRYDEARD